MRLHGTAENSSVYEGNNDVIRFLHRVVTFVQVARHHLATRMRALPTGIGALQRTLWC